jgi:hypothetical protein
MLRVAVEPLVSPRLLSCAARIDEEHRARRVRAVRMTPMRAICLAVGGVALAGCSIPPVPPEKGCPCVSDFTCKIESNQCVVVDTPPGPMLKCVIYTDGQLYCGDKPGALLDHPVASGSVVNHLLTDYSSFECWGTGDLHAGGNRTWYYTDGDDPGAPRGWLPGVNVWTPDGFDADPTKYGFRQCAP